MLIIKPGRQIQTMSVPGKLGELVTLLIIKNRMGKNYTQSTQFDLSSAGVLDLIKLSEVTHC